MSMLNQQNNNMNMGMGMNNPYNMVNNIIPFNPLNNNNMMDIGTLNNNNQFMMNVMNQPNMINNPNIMNSNINNGFIPNQGMMNPVMGQPGNILNNINNFGFNENPNTFNFNQNNNNNHNDNCINLIFENINYGTKHIINANINETMASVVNRYLNKSNYNEPFMYVVNGKKINEILTVAETGLLNYHKINAIPIQNLEGA